MFIIIFTLFLGMGFSIFASSMTVSAITLISFNRWGSFDEAFFLIIPSLASAFSAPIWGAYLDRFREDKCLIAINLLSIFPVVALAYVSDEYWWLLLILNGMLAGAFLVVFSKVLPHLIRSKNLDKTLGSLRGLSLLLTAIGISAGPLLFSLFDTHIFIIDGLSFLISALCFYLIFKYVKKNDIQINLKIVKKHRIYSIKSELIHGCKYLVKNKSMLIIFIFYLFVGTLWGVSSVVDIAFSMHGLNLPINAVGTYNASAVGGELVGSFIIALGLIKTDVKKLHKISAIVVFLIIFYILSSFFTIIAIGFAIKFIIGFFLTLATIVCYNNLIFRTAEGSREVTTGMVLGALTFSNILGRLLGGFLNQVLQDPQLVYFIIALVLLIPSLYLFKRIWIDKTIDE